MAIENDTDGAKQYSPPAVNDKEGHFKRQVSTFRDVVSPDPNAKFPAEKGRYILYVNYGCPWAHRTIIVRQLKGLEDIIPLVESSHMTSDQGWVFSEGADKYNGIRSIKELYWKADPAFAQRFTVPVLWDQKQQTIVNNESSEIIRFLYTAFDHLLPEELREETKGRAGFFPDHLRSEIENMNDWVYDTVNNGVYKTGFAQSQEAYDANVYALFESLGRLEQHLADPKHQPYLFGAHITDADVRLYTTLARFDVAYFTIFKCNLKMIRYEYPNLHKWLRMLYWDESERTRGGAFKNTTRFPDYKDGYASALSKFGGGKKIVPAGPVPDILPL